MKIQTMQEQTIFIKDNNIKREYSLLIGFKTY